MSIQYQTVVGWDSTLIDLEYTDADTAPTALQGLVKFAIKTTTGAPTATAGKFLEAAQILNAVDSTWYENTGTTASPTWSLVPSSGSGISQLTGDVTAGPGSGSQVATVAALNLETATVTGIADTEIFIGDGAASGTFKAISGDATLANTGVLTVTGATGSFEAGGAITNAGGTLAVGFIPTAVTQPQALTAPGAANITTYQTKYTSTGAGDVVTLADATRIGHLKKISYVAEGAGGDTCVVTPTNLEGFTTATLAAVGDYVLLMWNGANWLVIENVGATLA